MTNSKITSASSDAGAAGRNRYASRVAACLTKATARNFLKIKQVLPNFCRHALRRKVSARLGAGAGNADVTGYDRGPVTLRVTLGSSAPSEIGPSAA
jgi:hypothetical protein